jgi:predicted O-methyltransferase YrrM
VINRECSLRLAPAGGPEKKSLEEIFPGITKRTCRVQLIPATVYNVSWEEMCTLSQIVEAIAPKTIFEFGTFDGRTTLHLALNASHNALTYTVDAQSGEFEFSNDDVYFDKVRVGEHVLSSEVRPRVVQLTGDSKTLDLSSFAGAVDFIFIDADHSYAGVMNDSKIAFKMASAGAVIVWHDYLLVGDVTRALVELARTRPLVNLKGTSLVVWGNRLCRVP